MSVSDGPNSSDFIYNLYSQAIGVSWYNKSADFLAVAPHHMGVNIHDVDVQNVVSYEGYYSQNWGLPKSVFLL